MTTDELLEQATPRPWVNKDTMVAWRWDDPEGAKHIKRVCKTDGGPIYSTKEIDEANAEVIVLAVNTFEQAREALRLAMKNIDNPMARGELAQVIRAALSAMEGGGE